MYPTYVIGCLYPPTRHGGGLKGSFAGDPVKFGDAYNRCCLHNPKADETSIPKVAIGRLTYGGVSGETGVCARPNPGAFECT